MPETAPIPTAALRPIRPAQRHRPLFHRPTHRQARRPVQTPRYHGRYGAKLHGFPAPRRHRFAR